MSNQKNWIADPYEFNDPFEFSLIEKFLPLTNGKLERLEEEHILRIQAIQEQISQFGVVCYSSDYTNNLLWAHYADNHKGMCLVFDIPDDKVPDLHKVSYSKKFPFVGLNGTNIKDIIPVVTTKSIDWAYEQEYREVFLLKNKLHDYPGELKEIIFGCRTLFDDIKIVRDISVSKNENLKISKMHIAENYYGLVKDTNGDNKDLPKFWSLKNIKM
ncbi:MAG: DUF2971 domain-containing protein [Algicola sp.]|nr:DUF2971 domain-containing protein [Algicola sp.]